MTDSFFPANQVNYTTLSIQLQATTVLLNTCKYWINKLSDG